MSEDVVNYLFLLAIFSITYLFAGCCKKDGGVIKKTDIKPKSNNKFIQVTCRVTELLHIHDMDTFKVKVDNKTIMSMYPEGFSVRVYGINSAEVGGKLETGFFAKRRQQIEFKKGIKQRDFARQFLANSIIELQTICPDKYPLRIVCKVTVIKNGKRIDYSDYMIKHADAKKYYGKGEKCY